MRGLRGLADNRQAGSMADRFRRRRFALFRLLLDAVPVPADGSRLRILDVGGTPTFWERMGLELASDVEIVLLNLTEQEVPHERIRAVVGDAADMSMFADGEFDVVLSNSVIEHLPSLELQRRMAAEVRRVGRRHWVQTPDRAFPLEPHFLFPFFQHLPVGLRVALLRRMDLGWYPREPDPEAARAEVVSVRLMTYRELRDLFPGSQIVAERAFGLRKSFIVIGGWEARPPSLRSARVQHQRRDWTRSAPLTHSGRSCRHRTNATAGGTSVSPSRPDVAKSMAYSNEAPSGGCRSSTSTRSTSAVESGGSPGRWPRTSTRVSESTCPK